MPSYSKHHVSLPTPLRPHPRAIIIGASSGIGEAVALRLADQGYLLALLARREKNLKMLCEKINQQAGERRAIYYIHDITQPDVVPSLLQKIVADMGGLDVFIFSAGITRPPGIRNFDINKDLLTMQVNLLGALAWLNPVAALFQQLRSGQIVGISSVAGERGRVGNPAYNASKAALTCYLEALRNRLTRYGVNVLTIKPGFVQTDSLQEAKRTFWVITPDQAATGICKAIEKRKQEVYLPAIWRWVMLIVRNIPSIIFRRMNF